MVVLEDITRHFLREAKRLLVNADSDEQKRLLAIMEAFKVEEAKMKGMKGVI